MESQRYIVSVFFFIFIRIFFDDSLVFAMGGDKQIGSTEYITQAGHAVYQHISGARTHKQFHATNAVLVQLRKLGVVIIGRSEVARIVDRRLLAQ